MNKSLPIGAVLKMYRQQKHITVKELASMLRVNKNTIHNWESGRSRPDIIYIPTLCEILNAPLYELFGMEGYVSLNAMDSRVLQNFHQLAPQFRRMYDEMLTAFLEDEEQRSKQAQV